MWRFPHQPLTNDGTILSLQSILKSSQMSLSCPGRAGHLHPAAFSSRLPLHTVSRTVQTRHGKGQKATTSTIKRQSAGQVGLCWHTVSWHRQLLFQKGVSVSRQVLTSHSPASASRVHCDTYVTVIPGATVSCMLRRFRENLQWNLSPESIQDWGWPSGAGPLLSMHRSTCSTISNTRKGEREREWGRQAFILPFLSNDSLS